MDDDKPDTFQLRFEDGALVDRSTEGENDDGDHIVDPIEPGDRTGFVVEAKPGALDMNGALVKAVEAHGHTLDFGSRAHAENYARQLSVSGGSLRIQAAAENDPSEVDAYLLADHSPSIKEPARVRRAPLFASTRSCRGPRARRRRVRRDGRGGGQR